MKEQTVIINTREEKSAIEVSSLISGILDCVIVVVNEPVRLSIVLDEYPDIVLMKDSTIDKTSYFNLKTYSYDKEGKVWNYSPDNWILNNKLRISVSGKANITTAIIIRYR